MTHIPRKRFGQNFLHDIGVIDAIINHVSYQSTDKWIEIGPGQGALTVPLLKKGIPLDVIEIDKHLIHSLTELSKRYPLVIHEMDVLQFDFSSLQGKVHLIGNLPYNISTPLIFHVLANITHIESMLFMLQKEVVDRIAAIPNTKAYGRLSVMVQAICEVHPLLIVPPDAFTPAPKVYSSVVKLTKRKDAIERALFLTLEKVVKKAFGYRRKTLLNNLKGALSASELMALGFKATVRPEDLSVNDYIELTHFFINNNKIRNEGDIVCF
jgi:16S rRNA (adenine1518-N6/adenine1519-N6)-dimethyltransferase